MNPDMVARLVAVPEFIELQQHFEKEQAEAVARLGRKSFAQPSEHDVLEWERLSAYYKGISAVLTLPLKCRDRKDEVVAVEQRIASNR